MTPGDLHRRKFFGAAAMTIASAQLGLSELASAASGHAAGAPFGPVKQIDAGALNVGYVELGPVSGPPVLLLHGWPYDIHSFAEVAPILASAGHRVLVPHLRGYGTTRL